MRDCYEQVQKTEHQMVEELLDIVERKDDRLLPVFYQVLIDKDQRGVAEIIRQNVLKQQQQQQQQPGDRRVLALYYCTILARLSRQRPL